MCYPKKWTVPLLNLVMCPEDGLADSVSLGQDCSLGVGTVSSGFILLPDLSIQNLRVRMIHTFLRELNCLAAGNLRNIDVPVNSKSLDSLLNEISCIFEEKKYFDNRKLKVHSY